MRCVCVLKIPAHGYVTTVQTSSDNDQTTLLLHSATNTTAGYNDNSGIGTLKCRILGEVLSNDAKRERPFSDS